ncbi:MAG: preprotein translocase subunit TatB [Legionellales bacterium RIFCSPHIGHO2_12_FULL_42_9]|nr:MAG: preprotein translocase subunit TatB [Legionellales bacterium RIFCSPHIGHO2_12_FULL_42_9]
MISGELLVILLVACVVFGPNKLPMLARHLGLACRQLICFREQLNQFWQQQVSEQQLLHNQQKAEEADALYRNKGS